jgi:hypothetical protein
MQRLFDYRIYTALGSFIITLGMSVTALNNHVKSLDLESQLVTVYSDKFMLEIELLESIRKNEASDSTILQLQSIIANSKK